ncbi:MAG: TraR/DksA C4-type zinc finger protein [Alphaproteobacteria bacterium]|nr:TraR/DksA C4-type zinc finger protein [Alphaproteobacteria bacterium]
MAEELTPAELEQIGALLRAAELELRALIADEGGLTGTVQLDQSAVGRVSRVDALQQQQMALANKRRAERRMEAVEAALERFDEDPESFGWCPGCGEPIGVRRLRAVPESVFCVPCLQARGR